MSVIDHARSELALINFGADDSQVMVTILERFLDQWDSGGAVAVASDVFRRLLAMQPLSPLTGADDEWVDLAYNDDMVGQNKRCSTVFKRRDGSAYDIASGPRVPITFPYDPVTRSVEMPIYTVGS